ncbi:MAG TPA: hypothetical protein VNZ53_26610 [Steroidobacteraceae bacterium]|jgi:hypothetical protein|nr:hypothetical protein [Steroidobacteraceae bacterium]
MTDRKNLAAYTPGVASSPYISINTAGPDGSMVEITVRSEGTLDGNFGPTATIVLNRFHAIQVMEDAVKAIYADNGVRSTSPGEND